MTLLAAYSFDAGSGTTVVDDSGNGHTLTLGSATFTASGHTGAGITNTAANSPGGTATVPAVTGSPCSLMAWVKPLDLTAGTTHFICGVVESTGSPGNTDFALFTQRQGFSTANVLQADARVGGGLIAANGAAMTVGTWAHVAMTFDGFNLKLYKDGTLIATVPNTGALGNATSFYVAGAIAAAGVDTDVVVDDVRYFNSDESANISTWMSTPAGATTVTASATFAEASSFTAAPVITRTATAAFGEASSFTASPVSTRLTTATLTESSSLTASPTVTQQSASNFLEASSLAGNPVATQLENTTFVGTTNFTATPSSGTIAAAVFLESSNFIAHPTVTQLLELTFNETSTFRVTLAPGVFVIPHAGAPNIRRASSTLAVAVRASAGKPSTRNSLP